MIIAIDFDGTIVKHEFPNVGDPNPGAVYWIELLQTVGAKIILFTMRSDGEKAPANWDECEPCSHTQQGNYLAAAVEYCEANGIDLYGVNETPNQKDWTKSPKVYAHVYVDDAAFGCPLINPVGERPYVDWSVVGPVLLNLQRRENAARISQNPKPERP